jgi:hypothetical protein
MHVTRVTLCQVFRICFTQIPINLRNKNYVPGDWKVRSVCSFYSQTSSGMKTGLPTTLERYLIG